MEEEGTLAYSFIADLAICDPEHQASRCWRWTYEELPIRPPKLQLVWPTLHCEGSLHERLFQLDPWGMSLGWEGLMEVLLQFLQTQWTSQFRCRVVSTIVWSSITDNTNSSSRNRNGDKHNYVWKREDKYCRCHGEGTKLQVSSRSTCRTSN